MPKKIYDLEFSNNGLFTRFFPNTLEGEVAWKEMHKTHPEAIVLTIHANSVIAQLRKAGYSVAKQKPCKLSTDQILAELEA